MINIYVYICTISISTVCLIDNYYIDDINYCHNKINSINYIFFSNYKYITLSIIIYSLTCEYMLICHYHVYMYDIIFIITCYTS